MLKRVDNLLLILFSVYVLLLPVTVGAESNSFSSAVINIKTLIKTLTTIAYALAFLGFFWGFAKMIGTNSEEKKKDAVKIMVTSVAIIFIMTSVFGVVALLRNTLQIGDVRGDVRFPEVIPTN